MKKSLLFVFFLILLILTVSFPQIKKVNAQSTIYIRSDGTVEGTDKIQREGDVYSFSGDISGNIIVQRSFVIVDGCGFTLQGSGIYPEKGIDLSNNRQTDSSRPMVVNVTIKDIKIEYFATGVYYAWTTNNTILGNHIFDCGAGIEVMGGQGNVLIKLNTFENNTNDITINYSSGGTKIITQNNIENFVQVWLSDQPIVDMNYWAEYNGTDNDGDGIGDTPYYHHDILRDSHPLIEPVPVIPEFPSTIILVAGLVVITIMLIIYRRKRKFSN